MSAAAGGITLDRGRDKNISERDGSWMMPC